MIRPIIVAKKVIDWRDSSVFDVDVTANSVINFYFRPIAYPAILEFDFGNGYGIIQNATSASEYHVFNYTYPVGGTYKIRIKSTQLLDGLACNKTSRYNAGYARKISQLKFIYSADSLSNQDVTNYIGGAVDYVYIAQTNVKIDLSKIKFAQNATRIYITGNNPYLYGVVRVDKECASIIRGLELRGSNNAAQSVYSFNEIIRNTPNCKSYSFQYYVAAVETSSLEDMSLIIAPRANSIDNFSLIAVNAGLSGNGGALFKTLFESTSCQSIYIYSNLDTVSNQLGIQTNDYTNCIAKTVYLTRLTGDASAFNFKYKAVSYICLLFLPSAYGNINQIANVVQDVGTSVRLTLSSSTVLLSVENLKNIKFTTLELSASDNFSGDISTLGSVTMCTTWNITNINSKTITGYNELITNLYNNKSAQPTTIKVFKSSNIMKAALTGTYQAPSGFVKGSADGTPTSSREKIFVLVNNYNWTFTNI